ncbi:ABC transporter transmembrane domain-containing protein [Chitinophagales bacterium]|jgi:ATP-binding cassette, subfamily B, bacterial|nr:ABC transporter transmembrane domain-containing protein [Chitinophagales bacterium]
MEKTQQAKRASKKQLQSAQDLFKYIKPYKGYFILGLIFLAFSSLIFMVVPAAVGQMLKAAKGDTLIPYLNIHMNIFQYGWLFLAILLSQGLLSYLRVNVFAIVTENSLAQIRMDLYNKLLAQNMAFFEKNRVGDVVSRLSTDVEKLQQAFSITLPEFLRQIIVFVVGVALLLLYSVKLTLVMLAVFPLVIILAIIFGKYIKRLAKERQEYLAQTNVIVDETFQSFQSVKAYVNESFELNRYSAKMIELVEIALKYARAKGVFFTFIITGLFGALFFILWMGGIQVYEGSIEVEELTAFIFYAMVIGGSIAGLGNQYTELLGVLGATERVKEILDEDQELNIDESDVQVIQFEQEIRYENVVFSYPTRPDIEVLHKISFTVKKGQKVALVGSSGSGKSTIIKLLSRFYDLEQGNIFVDNNNIKDLEIKSVRKIIGIVPQEVILFGGSILENIRYGKLDASMEEVKAAAKQANALDFIKGFPEQFDTLVGERGVQLSGGQKQRVAIARAILKNPAILILDEATSSLDAESEKQVQDALENLMQNRTTFIIAHRLSTVRSADEILVLHQGDIVERGTHSRLLKDEEGFYAKLLKLQIEER